MCRCLLLLIIAAAALAQESSVVPCGAPLRVVLEHRVAIQRVDEPIEGRLVDPIYVFDRMVLPAGSAVEGHIAEIGAVPVRRRITAILSGNFTPPRDVAAQFNSVILSDGSRLSLSTSLSYGTAHTVRITAPGKKPQHNPAPLDFRPPGKMSQLKSRLIGMLPYHRQAWTAGTLFSAALQQPLTVPAPSLADYASAVDPEAQDVSARLLAPLSSASARKGAAVEAIVTRPVVAADHELLIPEGSHVLGEIVQARPARRFHRNGKLLFVFRQIKLPSGSTENIQGYVAGLDADFDAHLALDSEGASRASSPKTRFIFPALAVAAAGLSLHQDYNSQGVPDQDIGGRAESGAVGLGLVGTLLAQTSHALAASIAFTGAGFSVYSNFIARGEDVNLPANTPLKISLGAPRGRPPQSR
jgi:hypothetical protein